MKKKISVIFAVRALVAAAIALTAALASCVPPAPENQPAPNLSLFMRWTINGRQPDGLICRSLSQATANVEIWEDSNCDGDVTDGFYVYSFDCTGGVCVNPNREQHGNKCTLDDECGDAPGYCLVGAGKTGNAFFAGTDTCVKAVLISHAEEEDTIIAQVDDFGGSVCNSYCEVSLCFLDHSHCQEECYCSAFMGTAQDSLTCPIDPEDSFATCRDLGTINFDLPSYGPLDVDLAWQKEDGTFGACEEAGALFAGYRLEQRTDQEGDIVYTVFDEVGVEGTAACGARLSWPLVPFAYYRLQVEGRNDTGSIVWEADCATEGGGDLQVDSREDASNEFACQVTRR